MADTSGRFRSFMVEGVLIRRWRLYMFRFLGFAGCVFTVQTLSAATSRKLLEMFGASVALLALNFWTDWLRANNRTND